MGKKKSKGKKKGSGKKKKADGGGAVAPGGNNPGPTLFEISLRLQLEQLDSELELAKQDAEKARENFLVLSDELDKVQEENRQYEAYMQKKEVEEQNRLTQLQTNHEQELRKLDAEQERKKQYYDLVKKEVRDIIQERQNELLRTEQSLMELADVQEKRNEQSGTIASLEKKIDDLNVEHFQKLQDMKSRFLREKVQMHKRANDLVKSLEKAAPQEAIHSLNGHSKHVREQNSNLKKVLLAMIQENKELHAKEEWYKEKNAELQRQLEFEERLPPIKDEITGTL
eukprot:m.210779 g.210779  ORF g.210779 m.210779 type:complete len:284 (+) comp15826_c0_seq11:47-898(+)